MGECFFWYRPTRVVPDKRLLNGCVCVCVSSTIGPAVSVPMATGVEQLLNCGMDGCKFRSIVCNDVCVCANIIVLLNCGMGGCKFTSVVCNDVCACAADLTSLTRQSCAQDVWISSSTFRCLMRSHASPS